MAHAQLTFTTKTTLYTLIMTALLGMSPISQADDDDDETLSISGVQISGAVELEANFAEDFAGEDSSDFTVSTVEIGLSARLHEWVTANVLFLYEEDETDEVTVDEAYVTFANEQKSPFYLIAGRQYVPFGSYESFLVSDPLTSELGETQETALSIGASINGFYGEAFVFNGDMDEADDDNQINDFGVSLGYRMETEFTFAAGIDYMNDLADSDGFTEALEEELDGGLSDTVGGLAVHALFSMQNFTLMGEYVTAIDEFAETDLEFNEGGAEPKAWQIEAAYEFDVYSLPSFVAVSYQGTEDALELELPETRYSIGVGAEVYKNTALSLEWARDEDYDEADGGTGESADSVTLQLAVEF